VFSGKLLLAPLLGFELPGAHMRRDLLDDAHSGGVGTPAVLSIVAVLCFIALVAALALCGSSVSRSMHNSSPSTAAEENQPQSDSAPPEKEAVDQRQCQRVQEVVDSPGQVCEFCSAISLSTRHDPPL
jgi:hypothetical protein